MPLPKLTDVTIRAQLLAAIVVLILPIAILAATTIYGQRYSANATQAVADMHDTASRYQRMTVAVLALERNVLLYRQTANANAAERTFSSYDEILAELAALRNIASDETRLGLLDRMRKHLEDHRSNFDQVVFERQRREELVRNELTPHFAALMAQVDELQSAARNAVAIDKAEDQLSGAHFKSLEFLARPDFAVAEDVKERLRTARQGLAAARLGDALVELQRQVDEYEGAFLRIVQVTRGYLFLTNVVMAGSSDEYIRLADELTGLTAEAVRNLDESVAARMAAIRHASLAIAVVCLFVTLAVGSRLSESFSRRIGELTDVFNRLANGQTVESIPGKNRGDELGRMAAAANVFRSNNARTERLLEEARRLTLEQEKTNSELARQITEREAAEARLQSRTDELERSNEDLAQFAYVASHDLQEPLRMVTSYVQLIEDEYGDKLDESGREFIEFAVAGAKRMKTLITSLLEYSRVGTRARTPEETPMQDALDAAVKNLEVLVRAQRAEITSDELPVVQADRAQIEQLLQNLIGNALKFVREGQSPRIHVGAETNDDIEHRFSISDNGIGFEPEFADRIFTIFQRLNARHEYEGTGIGLAVCKKIVLRHGGRIWAESEPGNGTTVYFTLPVNPATTLSTPALKIAS